MASPDQPQRIITIGFVLSLAASAFFFWVWYERYLRWDFNELGRYYDDENQIVYTDAGFVGAAGIRVFDSGVGEIVRCDPAQEEVGLKPDLQGVSIEQYSLRARRIAACDRPLHPPARHLLSARVGSRSANALASSTS